ncbi:hypothetical protein NEFER03_2206 [Nematocida sp. LUAm3]|nr:hypothetical protein NEAUS07_2521 [Nematocida ausubeli]KAI5171232.1 hypothetical protein NEFER03_0634 [Nematocida sp. LUAm3]KAI5176426.1 hypothetical protein NEFER02_2189 [Nematocida sp. LUAm2]KAI5179291.1 hypothetical protein NEFER01_2140 [Nematocida sp. LUAm1]KAI5171851.1 hypothetical protein NEFER03_1116 [Nematocida sp. LUAm3]
MLAHSEALCGCIIRLTKTSLCTKIRYTPENYIYIDINGYSILCKKSVSIKLHDENLEDALEKIQAVWCENIFIESSISPKLAKILIERTLVKSRMHASNTHYTGRI